MFEINKINYRQLLPIIKEEWLVYVLVVVCVLISSIYAFMQPKLYSATLVINPPKLSDAGSGLSAYALNLSARNEGEVAIGIIKSNSVGNKVVAALDLSKYYHTQNPRQARTRLLGSINAIPDLKTGFISIVVDDKDPVMASKIANAFISALGQFISDIGFNKASQKKDFFENELKVAKYELDASESSLNQFSTKNGIIAANQMQVITGVSAQLQTQLINGQQQLQAMQHSMTPENSDYKQLENQLKSIKARLLALSGTSHNDSIPVPANLAPSLAQDYISLVKDYAFRSDLYQTLLRQYEFARLDEASDKNPVSIQVIDEAEPPLFPSKPNKKKIIGFTFLISTILCTVFVFVKNRTRLYLK